MVCMGSLIVASRYLYEVAEKTEYWAIYSDRFDAKEVFFFEREFLKYIDYKLAVDEEDLARVCSDLVAAGAIEAPRRASGAKAMSVLMGIGAFTGVLSRKNVLKTLVSICNTVLQTKIGTKPTVGSKHDKDYRSCYLDRGAKAKD